MRKFFATFATITAVSLVLTAVACQPLAGQDTAEDQMHVKVFKLQHSAAADTGQVLISVMESMPELPTIVPDHASNSLIVTGNPASLQQVADLLDNIDVPAQQNPELADQRLHVYDLGPDGAETASLLETLVKSNSWTGLRMQADRTGTRMYVMGDDKEHAKIEQVLQKIMENRSEESADENSSIYVSLTLVVDRNQLPEERQQAVRNPAVGVAELLDRAGEAGLVSIDNPGTVTSLVTNVRCAAPGSTDEEPPEGHFDNTSDARSAGYSLRNFGQLYQLGSGKFRLQSSIEVVGDSPTGDQMISEIQSDIVAKLDHPVLLSFSTIGDINTALIVELKQGE